MRTIVSNAIINYVTVHDTVVALHLTPYRPIVSLRAHNKNVALNEAFCSIDTKKSDYRLQIMPNKHVTEVWLSLFQLSRICQINPVVNQMQRKQCEVFHFV